jgi:TRAP-type C4-dicarboxylate transport system substrate-binding protein
VFGKVAGTALAGALLACTIAMTPARAQEPVELTFSYPTARNQTSLHRAFGWYFDEVEKRTEGRVKFKQFWGTLLEPLEALDGISQGIVDSAFVVPNYWPDKLPLASSLSSTILFGKESIRDSSNIFWTLWSEFPEMEQEFTRQNQKLLWMTSSNGGLVVFSKNPILKLDDFNGLKIRVPGSVAPWFAAIGATGVSIPPTEVYDAISKGVVEGAFVGLESGYRNKWQEVAKNVLNLGAGELMASFGLSINLDKFNALSPADQKVLTDTGQELVEIFATYWEADASTIDAALKDQGVTVSKLSVEDQEKWRLMDALNQTREAWVVKAEGRGLPGRRFMDRLVALVGR